MASWFSQPDQLTSDQVPYKSRNPVQVQVINLKRTYGCFIVVSAYRLGSRKFKHWKRDTLTLRKSSSNSKLWVTEEPVNKNTEWHSQTDTYTYPFSLSPFSLSLCPSTVVPIQAWSYLYQSRGSSLCLAPRGWWGRGWAESCVRTNYICLHISTPYALSRNRTMWIQVNISTHSGRYENQR